jgi:hypothetical protein
MFLQQVQKFIFTNSFNKMASHIWQVQTLAFNSYLIHMQLLHIAFHT